MTGGGTQAFFAALPDGTVRFLPFDYSKALRRWFCNTLGRGNKASVPISPEIRLADCGDWPPTRTLGSTDRYPGCQQCHGSQIDLGFDTASHRYQTRYTTLAINCESCHGPARTHVELARAGRIDSVADIGMRPLETLDKDASLQVCFQCHALKNSVDGHFVAGNDIRDHFALKLPALLDTLYLPDGRTRAFAYQEGHLSSDCYLNGSMTCVSCHDPHSQQYRDNNFRPLPGRLDDGQCTGCHPSKVNPPTTHTHHATGSAGSRCVACHMPYLQEPSVGGAVRYARSDHTIPVPRPVHDATEGIEPACQQCHRERTAAQLQAQVDQWYGELKPLAPLTATAFAADRAKDAGVVARLLASAPAGTHPMAQFSILKSLLMQNVDPDSTTLDRQTITRLQEWARDRDIELQSVALATLHLLRGADPRVRDFLAETLRQLGEREQQVRHRWAWVLKARGDVYLKLGDPRRAILAFEKGKEIEPAEPSLFRGAGVAYTRLRDYDKALTEFGRSLELNPAQADVLVEQGFAQLQRGDADGAIAAFRRAVVVNPTEAPAYANLGLVYLRRGDTRAAEDALQRAVSLDPTLADASFLLANAYASAGRIQDASRALERGLEFDPRNPGALRMRDALQHHQSGSTP
jgi:tetratricopeptide (TPR) repeat protein